MNLKEGMKDMHYLKWPYVWKVRIDMTGESKLNRHRS